MPVYFPLQWSKHQAPLFSRYPKDSVFLLERSYPDLSYGQDWVILLHTIYLGATGRYATDEEISANARSTRVEEALHKVLDQIESNNTRLQYFDGYFWILQWAFILAPLSETPFAQEKSPEEKRLIVQELNIPFVVLRAQHPDYGDLDLYEDLSEPLQRRLLRLQGRFEDAFRPYTYEPAFE